MGRGPGPGFGDGAVPDSARSAIGIERPQQIRARRGLPPERGEETGPAPSRKGEGSASRGARDEELQLELAPRGLER